TDSRSRRPFSSCHGDIHLAFLVRRRRLPNLPTWQARRVPWKPHPARLPAPPKLVALPVGRQTNESSAALRNGSAHPSNLAPATRLPRSSSLRTLPATSRRLQEVAPRLPD